MTDRIFGAVPYLLPLMDVLIAGYEKPLLHQFPILEVALVPLMPFLQVYSQLLFNIPFAGMILFFVLYMAVVRNENLSRFVRFNVMQALLLDIILILCNLILPILA
nr:Tic20 family protein [Neosynechococcus sphagnicola]